MAPPPSPSEKFDWRGFRKRLGFYCFGLAIGLLALGFFQVMKNRVRQDLMPPSVPMQGETEQTTGAPR